MAYVNPDDLNLGGKCAGETAPLWAALTNYESTMLPDLNKNLVSLQAQYNDIANQLAALSKQMDTLTVQHDQYVSQAQQLQNDIDKVQNDLTNLTGGY